MSDMCKEHLDRIRLFAVTNNLVEHLTEKLDYLRTYGDRPEGEMRTELFLDCPFRKEEMNIMATIYKIVDSQKHPIIQIAMMFDKHDQRWYTHS